MPVGHTFRSPLTFAGSRLSVVLVVVVALIVGLLSPTAAHADPSPQREIGTWSASSMPSRTSLTFENQSLRMIVRTSAGGENARFRLSNLHGTVPLTLADVHVGNQLSGADIVPGTNRPLTFNGADAVTIPVGQEVWSDPLEGAVAPEQDLVVSVYVVGASGRPTDHWRSSQQTWFSPSGNQAAEESGQAYTAARTTWWFLNSITVESAATAGTIAVLGDSLTDGYLSTMNANARYPDALARRLLASGSPLGVVNLGVAGHDVRAAIRGRFAHDVVTQRGVDTILFLGGINDINGGSSTATVTTAIAGVISDARTAGLRIVGGTLPPQGGSSFWTQARETTRQQVNAWIRAQAGFDAVVDFDATLRDPGDSNLLRAEFDSGDHLHPSDAGYTAMANALDLSMLGGQGPAVGTVGQPNRFIAPSDAGVRLIGQWDRSSLQNGTTTVNSGNRVLFRFTGTQATAVFDTAGLTVAPQVWARVDGGPRVLYSLDQDRLRLTGRGLEPGDHTLEIVVKDIDEHYARWTAPLASAVKLRGFEIDQDGQTTAPAGPTGPRFDFYGDSITQGVRALSMAANPDGSDGTLGFAYLTARAFDADSHQVGFGRQGITVTGNGGVPKAVDTLGLNFAGSPAADSAPAVVVVNQGTNDSSVAAATFKTGYVSYLRAIRRAHPDAWILALRPFGGFQSAGVSGAVAQIDDHRIAYVDTTGWLDTSDYTDGVHPSAAGHAKAAARLIPKIAEITGITVRTGTVSVTAEAECAAGAVRVDVRVRNDTYSSLDLALSSSFGSTSLPGLGSGGTTTHTFDALAPAVSAGEIAVQTTNTAGGTAQYVAVYPALDCAGETGVAPDAPAGLLTNDLTEPLNVDDAPRFGWLPQDRDLDEKQTSYQIVVTDTITHAQVWDSGRVKSPQQSDVVYAGPSLAHGRPFEWVVRTWDVKGNVSPYSAPASFATGLADADWDASWLRAPVSPLSTIDGESVARIEGGGITLNDTGYAIGDVAISVDVRPADGNAGVVLRASDARNGYVVSLVPGTGVVVAKLDDDTRTMLRTTPFDIVEGHWYTVAAAAQGDQISITVDGVALPPLTDATHRSGTFGFEVAPGDVAEYGSLSVTASPVTRNWGKVTGNNSNPIILNDAGYAWTDYTVDLDVRIDRAAAGLMLRSPDFRNGYMWQISPAKGLARHVLVNNVYTKLPEVAFPFVVGQVYHLTISLSGPQIRTYVDGVLIDTYTEATAYATGTFGFREPVTENASFANVDVTAPDGTRLLFDDFSAGTARYKYQTGAAATIAVAPEAGQPTFSGTDFTSISPAWKKGDGTAAPVTSVQGAPWLRVNGGDVTLSKTGSSWTNYTFSAKVKVVTSAAGFVFRAPDSANGYMWQVTAGALRTHVKTAGKHTLLKSVAFPFVVGQSYKVTISVAGSEIRTYVDGQLVDTTTDSTWPVGGVGFRQAEGTTNEVAQFANVVVSSGADVLLRDDFTAGTAAWAAPVKAASGNNIYWYARTERALEGKPVARVLAYVAGEHDYELNVNGSRIGRGQTFDYVDEARYQAWDVTEAVGGDGRIAIGLLHRWYNGGQGRAASNPGLLARVIVYYEDGTSQAIVTDGTWTASATPLSGSSKRNAEGDFVERYDARLDVAGWTDTGFDDSRWTPAFVVGAHPNTTFPSVRADQARVGEYAATPKSVTRLADGRTIVDFGVVIPARLAIDFAAGVDGRTVTLKTGYELTSGGAVNTADTATQHTNMTFVLTQRTGRFTYSTFDHLGFRYLEIPNVGEQFEASAIRGTIIHSEVAEGRAAEFTSSDETLNAVYEMMARSAIYSVQQQFVDTPTREKGQFLQDAINISAVTTMTSYERASTRKAILQFLDSADRYWNSGTDLGRFNAVYPNADGKRDIPDFTLNLGEWVWQYYRLSGDRDLLKRAYPYLQQTADYVTRAIPTSGPTAGLVTNLPGGSGAYVGGIVDFPVSMRFGYDMSTAARTTVNALSVRLFDRLASMAAELERPAAESADYAARGEALAGAMNEKLLNPDGVYSDGLLTDGTQSAHAGQQATSFSMAAGVAPEERFDQLAEFLAGFGMRQAPMTADILLQALVDADRRDVALELLTNPDDYGWAQLLAGGATFTWEQWTHGESQSHGWGATSATNVLEDFLGIRVTDPGASTIEISPAWAVLDSAEGSVFTERGRVATAWSGNGADAKLQVSVPVNMTAELVFPSVTDGRFVEVGGNSGPSRVVDGHQVITVGSGERRFEFRPIDTTPPLISGLPEGILAQTTPLQLDLDVTDPESGISSVNVSIGDREVDPDEPIDLAGLEGEREVKVRALNGEGLTTVATSTVLVLPRDTAATAPSAATLSNTSGWAYGLHDGNYDVAMNLWWGTPGTVYRLFENDELVLTRLLPGTGTSQSTSVTMTGKANGTYVYTAQLLNSQGVTSTSSTTVVVNAAAPGAPVLSHDNWDGDGSFTATANMWWGTNATSYRFRLDGEVVATAQLTANTPNAQRATVQLTGIPIGNHTLVAEFVNARGVSISEPVTITVSR